MTRMRRLASSKHLIPVLLLLARASGTLSFASESPALPEERLQEALRTEVFLVEGQQEASGAFIEMQCQNRHMSRLCQPGTSLFSTALVADSLSAAKDHSWVTPMRKRAEEFLQNQKQAFGTLVKYYPVGNPLNPLLKFDVDDNSIVLSVLTQAGYPSDPESGKLMIDQALKKMRLKRNSSSPASSDRNIPSFFEGRVFSTWLKPSKPLFRDVDAAVNANALWYFGLQSQTEIPSPDLSETCAYVNQVTQWAAASGANWPELYNDRSGYWVRSSDYSAWYPSPYLLPYNIVRAFSDGRQACLAPSIERIRELLRNFTSAPHTSTVDLPLAAATAARLLEQDLSEGHVDSELRSTAEDLVSRLVETRRDGRQESVLYFGAPGYIGSRAYEHALRAEAIARLLRVRSSSSSSSKDSPLPPAISLPDLHQRIALGLDYLRREQASDGSWTKLIQVSSVMYSTHVIFLYEYMNRLEEKREIVSRLMKYIWSQQNPSGAFSGYPGGPDNLDVSVLAYLAAGIAGEAHDSARILSLESAVQKMGGIDKAGTLALPYLAIFGQKQIVECMPSFGLGALMHLDGELPWIRVMIYPLMYLLGQGKTHQLPPEKSPRLHESASYCPEGLPHPLRGLKLGKKRLFKWLENSFNDDGTLFDYTPTTVPALMALSSEGARYQSRLETALKTLESFQQETPEGGLYQAPGEASIGETYVILNALLDLGFTPENAMVQGAERFLYATEQRDTGAFGFSKHNSHFADSDDTSNSIYVLKRTALLRGESDSKRFRKGLDWLISLQNEDGGFGTWEKERLPIIRKLLHQGGKSGLVLSESVAEHTARIVLNLSLFKNEDPRYAEAYQRALDWLIRTQRSDGGYPGTWFVDYLFGTSMVMTALGTQMENPAARLAVEKGLSFIMAHQRSDGGFGEDPDSFFQKKSVPLLQSSPAQTGLIVSQLFMFLREEGYTHWNYLRPSLERAIAFLMKTQHADGLWHDATWSGVTFPKVEYLVYPYIQEAAPIQALGMYERAVTCHPIR